MKLIDKLATDAANEHDCSDPYVCEFREGFKAGFRKALEMALQCVLNGERIPNSYYTDDIESAIKSLGDKEI